MTTSHGVSYFVGPAGEPDKYRLLQQVGRGGEAELWQAELSVDGGAEPVAIKMQHDESRHPLSERRWSEQAELLRFVAHPGVVGVREFFAGPRMHPPGSSGPDHEQVLYLVMNWVDGMPLDEWSMVNRTAPDRVPRLLRHLAQAADVLDWLHSGRATPSRRPVIHGDLSPGNIMVTATGQAMLVDFGLVRLVSHQTSRAAGTPGYAAPEVWHSGSYSPASDRFSFGAIAYFALTGTPPPPEPNAIRSGLAALPLLAGVTPERLDRLMAIFSPRPDDRPAAGDWLRDLRETALSSTASSPPVPPGPPPGMPPGVPRGASTVVPTRPQPPAAAAAPAPPFAPERTVRPRRRFLKTKITSVLVVLLLVLGGGVYLGVRFSGGSGTTGPAASTTAAPPTSGYATADPGAPPAIDPARATVRRGTETQPIRLTEGYSVDVDSLAADWGVSTSEPEGADLYLSSSGDYLQTSGGTDLAPTPSADPDFATCQSATGYISRVDLRNLAPRTSYCLRTSQKRYALITLENAQAPLVLDVTVWDPPRPS